MSFLSRLLFCCKDRVEWLGHRLCSPLKAENIYYLAFYRKGLPTSHLDAKSKTHSNSEIWGFLWNGNVGRKSLRVAISASRAAWPVSCSPCESSLPLRRLSASDRRRSLQGLSFPALGFQHFHQTRTLLLQDLYLPGATAL